VLSSQSGQVADPSTDSRPSIGGTRAAQTTPTQREATPEPKETVVAQAGSPLSRPFVQAGIFSVAANAQKLISRLRSANIPAEGKPMRFRGQSMTRVLAGPFQTSAERREAQNLLRRFGIKDAVPVRR
jgi:cell division septation protein DedD